MAKAKTTKPLFSLKQDFVDSLEAFSWAAINLQQAIETALELNTIDSTIRPTIEKHLAHFKHCMVGRE